VRIADDLKTLAGRLLSPEVTERLIANGRQQAEAMARTGDEIDFCPVVKLITPDAEGVWLLTEIDPADHDLAFGICDLGIGEPRPDHVRVCDLEFFFGPDNWPVVADTAFVADRPISAYLNDARRRGRIVA
jgi:hypothetical protein